MAPTKSEKQPKIATTKERYDKLQAIEYFMAQGLNESPPKPQNNLFLNLIHNPTSFNTIKILASSLFSSKRETRVQTWELINLVRNSKKYNTPEFTNSIINSESTSSFLDKAAANIDQMGEKVKKAKWGYFKEDNLLDEKGTKLLLQSLANKETRDSLINIASPQNKPGAQQPGAMDLISMSLDVVTKDKNLATYLAKKGKVITGLAQKNIANAFNESAKRQEKWEQLKGASKEEKLEFLKENGFSKQEIKICFSKDLRNNDQALFDIYYANNPTLQPEEQARFNKLSKEEQDQLKAFAEPIDKNSPAIVDILKTYDDFQKGKLPSPLTDKLAEFALDQEGTENVLKLLPGLLKQPGETKNLIDKINDNLNAEEKDVNWLTIIRPITNLIAQDPDEIGTVLKTHRNVVNDVLGTFEFNENIKSGISGALLLPSPMLNVALETICKAIESPSVYNAVETTKKITKLASKAPEDVQKTVPKALTNLWNGISDALSTVVDNIKNINVVEEEPTEQVTKPAIHRGKLNKIEETIGNDTVTESDKNSKKDEFHEVEMTLTEAEKKAQVIEEAENLALKNLKKDTLEELLETTKEDAKIAEQSSSSEQDLTESQKKAQSKWERDLSSDEVAISTSEQTSTKNPSDEELEVDEDKFAECEEEIDEEKTEIAEQSSSEQILEENNPSPKENPSNDLAEDEAEFEDALGSEEEIVEMTLEKEKEAIKEAKNIALKNLKKDTLKELLETTNKVPFAKRVSQKPDSQEQSRGG